MWIKMRQVWVWCSCRDPRAGHRCTPGADRPISACAAQEERHCCGGARHGKVQTLLPHDWNNLLPDWKSFANEMSFLQFVLHRHVLQPNACATFNFLTAERRVAAAGLIPPPISTALDLTNVWDFHLWHGPNVEDSQKRFCRNPQTQLTLKKQSPVPAVRTWWLIWEWSLLLFCPLLQSLWLSVVELRWCLVSGLEYTQSPERLISEQFTCSNWVLDNEWTGKEQ